MIRQLMKRLSGPSPGTLSGSMHKMESLESLFATAVESYAAAVDSVSEAAGDSPRGARDEFRKKLKQLRATIRASTSQQTFEECKRQFDGEVKRFGRLVEEHAQTQERDAKEIMAIVATMADSVASREKQHNVRFKGIARKLRLLTTSTDLGEIRQRLSEEVGQLDKYVEDMARDTQSALERVRADLEARQDVKRTQPWMEEAVDPVTQLAGRPEAMAALATRLRQDPFFCVVLFSVEGYADLSTRQGRPTAESLLKEFALRLKTLLPEATLLARWNEAEGAGAGGREPAGGGRTGAGAGAALERSIRGGESRWGGGSRVHQLRIECAAAVARRVRPATAGAPACRAAAGTGFDREVMRRCCEEW